MRRLKLRPGTIARTSWFWTLLVGLLALTIVGCPRPLALSGARDGSTVQPASQFAAEDLVGRVAHHPYRTQATLGDIAVGASVSLIDTITNLTVASSVTDASGSFRLQRLNPTPDRTYYLEATKGLPMGGDSNRAGFPGARVRTIVQFNPTSGWRSITANGITINAGTTALAAILSLRSAVTPRPSEAGLLGSLVTGTPDVFTPGSSNVSATEYATVQDLAATALNTDNDPLAIISYDTANGQYYIAQRGISVTMVSPLRGPIGTVVRLEGSSLSSAPVVRFNGVQATSVTVNSVQTVALARVPVGATSGPLTLQVGTLVYSGSNFAVNNWDGHNVFDRAGNLYVAGFYDNAIWRFDPNGEASIAASSSLFTNPRGIAVDAWDNLYVTSWANHKIYQVTPGGAINLYAEGGALRYPWGLAINAAGDLFVANYGNNNILKLASGSALPMTPTVYPSTGLFNPSRLAFDLAGYLYVTNHSGNGTVARVAPDGTTVTLATNLGYPGGIALDSLGNAYVGAYGANAVYKITPGGQLSTFASLPDYDDSVAFHPDGTLYVSSFYHHWVARLDSLGRVLNYFTPGHLTFSLEADSANNLYVTSGMGRGANMGMVVKNAWDAATGTHRSPRPLVTGLPDPSALAFAPNGELFIGDWTGLIYRADPTTGNAASYMAGVGNIAGMDFDPSGNLYAGISDSRQIVRINNGAITKRWGTTGRNLSNMIKGPDGAYYIPDYSGNTILRLKDHALSVYSNNGGAGFGNPQSCVFDAAGNMFVAGWNSGSIYRIATGSLAVTTYATGLTTAAGLAIDAANNLYCTEWNSKTLKKITPGSPVSVTTLATLPANSRGLTCDPVSGNLYVAGWNKEVYRYSPTGTLTSLGTMPDSAWGVTLVGSDLYVACYGTGGIQRLPVTGGTPTTITTAVGNASGVVREAGCVVVSSYSSPMIYRVDDAAPDYPRIIADNGTGPGGLLVDPKNPHHVYVTGWGSGCLYRLDTQADTFTLVANSRDWLNGQTNMTGLAWGPDDMLYVQNWGSGVYKLNPALINGSNNAGVTFYGGNGSSAGLLGGIVFGPGGWLYGTSYTWMSAGSTHLVKMQPGGLPNNAPATRIHTWPDVIQF